ncbi:polyamine aminopropyltransferase [Streptomyces sp. NPDC046887]|uniref:polyamine aminopropyltransferase n=1 Tax=Streptomyces sp. NPDC046887 TaxID=3155472 RepID=UPI0033E2904E
MEGPAGAPEPGARPRSARLLVLAAVFVCAACGLVYELELVALSSYLAGDSVTHASVVLSVMVFAMGLGSLLAKRLVCRAAVGFGLVEAALALVGGCSALVLYAAFAWVGASRIPLVVFSLAIGVLIGAEVPLLMTLIQRVSRRRGPDAGAASAAKAEQDAGGAVADLFAADYVGALVGGLAFPFLLLPWLGQLTSALATGAVNAVAGAVLVFWLFGRDLTARQKWLLLAVNGTVLLVLATTALLVADFERAARRAVYGDAVRVAVHTGVQEVVLAGPPGEPPDLFLDGRLRVRGQDERRYHRALVHPAMRGPHARVLVLGGGDGLALREVLGYRDVAAVTVVELDPGVVRVARTDPSLTRLNHRAYADPRVRVVHADAFVWLRRAAAALATPRFDVVVSDLPDPESTAGAKLYSQEFYGLAARSLAGSGRLVVHAGAPGARPRAFWTVDATLRAAGFATRLYRASAAPPPPFPYHPGHPSAHGRVARGTPGDWGFVLAARGGSAPLRSVDGPGTDPVEGPPATDIRPSTLVHPRYAE